MRTDTTSSRRLTRRTRPGAAFAAGLALVAVTGCGSSDNSDSSRAPTEAPNSAATPSASPADSSNDELARVVTGAPKDLTWGLGRVPSAWRQLVKKQGELQWGVGEKCVLTLQQPGGLGKKEPTQDQVVRDAVAFLERGTKVDLTQGDVARRQFPVRSNLDEVAMTTAVSVADFTGPRGVQGQVYAHRAGEFALVLLTVCGGDTYTAVDKSDLRPFIEDLVVQATY